MKTEQEIREAVEALNRYGEKVLKEGDFAVAKMVADMVMPLEWACDSSQHTVVIEDCIRQGKELASDGN